uniref:TIR domain-containing protein n=1 Tax=Dunaliella tertiolecta TaxID=3047 RepID=A0A6S8K0C2_DUNTE|eukprot:CAMPEP_0202374486 /NCGR_PEP_ID=MMETSP1127-20130417/5305_1 /ASSEMBLY_ACC=CAM_ASM_000462 /TAXON_ID=3047 /ORGANISM="Dunaliella tertiolecta, Strain CCMP1320" /LENGTH=600 /DNA_ID=CAMNT_0048971651 /DNA_START=303 /DNA_END=2108 /DNA_ORIENTATION=+
MAEDEERRLSSFMSKRAAPMSRRGSSVEAALSAISSTGSTEPVVDVLISYKRKDALSFAFMLHTALVLRGVGCLLDYEYKPDLSDVEQVVARCRNLLLILTDEVLNSERCLQELEAAARHSVHVVIVVKEGARWGDASGNMLSYPPQQTIRALKPAVQTVFSLKAVHHREEHYGYFVTQLVKRLKRALPAAPQTTRKVRQSQAGAALPSPPGGDPPRKPRLSVLGMPISSFADPQQQQRVSESGVKPATPPAQTLPIGESTTLSTAHSASLDGISSEVAALRQMLALGAGQQQAIQALQAEIAMVRREVVAEVVASTRNMAASLTGEMAAMLQEVKGSIGNEAAGHANTLAALKAEITASVNAATSGVRAELGQEMSLNMRHLAADVAELRQSMAVLLSQQQHHHHSGSNSLAITSMPNLNSNLSPDPSSASFPPSHVHTLKHTKSAESSPIQPHPPPYPPMPLDPSVSPFGAPISGHDAPANGLANAAILPGLAGAVPTNSGTGSLLPPLAVNAGAANGVTSPPQHQARHTLPKTVAGTRDLPHSLLGNGGGVSPVGSMTPNVGGFAGPRLLAAQQQQYQQQRAMQVAAARSKGAGLQH